MTEEDFDTPEGRERAAAEFARTDWWDPLRDFWIETGFSIGRGFDRIGDGVKKAVRWFRPPPPPPAPEPEPFGPPIPKHIQSPGFYDEEGNLLPAAYVSGWYPSRKPADTDESSD